MKTHPVAELFPMLLDRELQDLADDIKLHGLQNPVVVQGDVLLDGRNRLAACKIAGVKATFREYKGSSPVAFIISANLKRRNLDKSQCAALAVEIEPHFAAEAEIMRRKKISKSRKGETVELFPPSQKSRDQAADVVGVSGKLVSEAKAVKRESPETFEKIKSGQIKVGAARKELREAKREERRKQNAQEVKHAKKLSDVEGKFSTILIDPPWSWDDEGDVNQMGRAKPDYAGMTIREITNLPVKKLSDTDAHIYCWITNRSLPKGFNLLDAWGFRYVTMLTWPKKSFGMGNYFRGQTEHILFGIRGSLMLKRKNASTLLPTWDRGKDGHSSKPEEIREFIESCSPGPYLELFSRSERNGWVMWGERQ